MINLKTENDRDVFIFDDVFEAHQIQKMYYFILNSKFRLNVNDDDFAEYKTKYSQTFGCEFSEDDLKRFGLLEYLPNTIKEKFNLKYDNYGRCIVNNITPLDTHYPHDDSGKNMKWSLLYYANLKWELEWGADTLFLTDNKKNISQVSQCKPNRVVIFDGRIPHMIRPSTMAAPHYRWSINMTFGD
ncbi:2OG-Fe(II) oxygenase [bacterium]|nr:2OG-Fe(II) oxygenase [bacterium]